MSTLTEPMGGERQLSRAARVRAERTRSSADRALDLLTEAGRPEREGAPPSAGTALLMRPRDLELVRLDDELGDAR
jgi:hypothetical protein